MNQLRDPSVVDAVRIGITRRWRSAIAIALACSICATWWYVPASGSVARRGASNARGPLVRNGHIALGTCPFAAVDLRVLLARTTYTSFQPVDVLAVARNEGSSACTYSGTGHGGQFIGPCGAFSMSVIDSNGTSIWPGPVAYSCPLMIATRLAPGAQIRVTGSWPKLIVTHAGSSPAPSGTYQLVIANTVTLTIRLT